MTVHLHKLDGCAPTPLGAYLKALAVLRLVAEQRDPEARGFWRDESFWLSTTLYRDLLLSFFLEEYQPTPILSPWNGGSGFFYEDDAGLAPLERSTAPRLARMRDGIAAARRMCAPLEVAIVALKEADETVKRVKKEKAPPEVQEAAAERAKEAKAAKDREQKGAPPRVPPQLGRWTPRVVRRRPGAGGQRGGVLASAPRLGWQRRSPRLHQQRHAAPRPPPRPGRHPAAATAIAPRCSRRRCLARSRAARWRWPWASSRPATRAATTWVAASMPSRASIHGTSCCRSRGRWCSPPAGARTMDRLPQASAPFACGRPAPATTARRAPTRGRAVSSGCRCGRGRRCTPRCDASSPKGGPGSVAPPPPAPSTSHAPSPASARRAA